MTLLDFYTPLHLKNILISLAFLVCFDVIGERINRLLIKSNEYYQSLRWLFGMGFFVFVWYFLGFVFLPNSLNLILSLTLVTLPFLPGYIKGGFFGSILGGRKILIWPLLLLLPLLPVFWIKASLPPYQWDELAYHYSSPWGYHHIVLRHLTDGFYENIPRLYDSLYAIMFSFSKTYSIARLFHFLTYFSAFTFVFHWLKRTSGLTASLIFSIIMLYIPADITYSATSGYVDIAANVFILMGTISTIEFIRQKTPLTVPTSFWALALGTRYNSLIPFVSIMPLLAATSWRHVLSYRVHKKLVSVIIVFVVLGGFWYLKNLLLTGNPIFPFIFPCFRFQETCQSMQGYLGDWWLLKVNFQNLPDIIYYTLAGSKSLAVISALTFFLATQIRKKFRFEVWFLIAFLLTNFILIKYLSGFLFRYFIYTQYLVFLIIALVLDQTKFTHKLFSGLRWLALGFTIVFIVRQMPRSISRAYSPEKLPQAEINFALGKSTVYDWADYLFPKSGALIRWCDRPDIEDEIPITFYDPDITWYQFEGRFNAFLHKCAIVPPPIDAIEDPQEALKKLIGSKAQFNLVSLTPCLDGKIIPDLQESSVALDRRRFSDLLVCNSQPTSVPTLYRFNKSRLYAE